ncbi:MAG TPA: serine hydrolase, partial [Hyphomonas sp.]|nr:serine hydrolase [Hyphomonas sp.]
PVEGYRSYILFDPDRDTGVVILWNSSSRRPNGIGFEVMDMVYNLPFRDWMELDAHASAGSR